MEGQIEENATCSDQEVTLLGYKSNNVVMTDGRWMDAGECPARHELVRGLLCEERRSAGQSETSDCCHAEIGEPGIRGEGVPSGWLGKPHFDVDLTYLLALCL